MIGGPVPRAFPVRVADTEVAGRSISPPFAILLA